MAGWFTGCKVDAVAFSSAGVYSQYYGAGEEANLANLYASLGLVEDAPNAVLDKLLKIIGSSFKKIIG